MVRSHCKTPIVAGIDIMGTTTKRNKEKIVRVFHGDTEILNGSTVSYVDNIRVTMEPKAYQMVLETSPTAKFEGTACGGHRNISNGAIIRVVENKTQEVTKISILGAWAKTYQEGVQIVEPFHFFYSAERNGIEL